MNATFSAARFAEDWAGAWSEGRLDDVLAHYSEDVVFTSPRALAVVGSAVVTGREELAAYWRQALDAGPVQFFVEDVAWHEATSRLVIRYQSTRGHIAHRAVELFEFDRSGRVCRGEALYGAAVDPDNAGFRQSRPLVPMDGWELHTPISPFLALVGPLYRRQTEKDLRIGLRAEDRHCNSRGSVHGGVLATVADVALGYAFRLAGSSAQLTTAGIAIDFIAAVPTGAWVEARTEVVHRGGRLAHSQCLLFADDRLMARGNGTFVVQEKGPRRD